MQSLLGACTVCDAVGMLDGATWKAVYQLSSPDQVYSRLREAAEVHQNRAGGRAQVVLLLYRVVLTGAVCSLSNNWHRLCLQDWRFVSAACHTCAESVAGVMFQCSVSAA